jgi:probable non-F420 flavinoid oxidoreductase
MTSVGYHASHEQLTPGELLRLVRKAEDYGFGSAMCSDHFAPWSEAQGQSGYTWSWLGSALQASELGLGTVCAPGYRYHPAIVAQAVATLEQMYPGRLWVALASGEAMNERMTGMNWPSKTERNARLLECVDIIRRLLAGETVTHRGRVTVEEAKLWTRPEHSPPIFGAALTSGTATWCGSWADGLVTVAPSPQLEDIIAAFRSTAGQTKPVYLQVHLSYASSIDEARANAIEQWSAATLPAAVGQELRSPEQFDAITKVLPPGHIEQCVHISPDPGLHRDWLQRYVDIGFDQIFLHNVGRNQDEFIETFSGQVLPLLNPKFLPPEPVPFG